VVVSLEFLLSAVECWVWLRLVLRLHDCAARVVLDFDQCSPITCAHTIQRLDKVLNNIFSVPNIYHSLVKKELDSDKYLRTEGVPGFLRGQNKLTHLFQRAVQNYCTYVLGDTG
jgi:hypothetical protein